MGLFSQMFEYYFKRIFMFVLFRGCVWQLFPTKSYTRRLTLNPLANRIISYRRLSCKCSGTLECTNDPWILPSYSAHTWRAHWAPCRPTLDADTWTGYRRTTPWQHQSSPLVCTSPTSNRCCPTASCRHVKQNEISLQITVIDRPQLHSAKEHEIQKGTK